MKCLQVQTERKLYYIDSCNIDILTKYEVFTRLKWV